jgi:hypothetical protein
MSEAIAFLLWLVFVGISAIIIGYFLKYNGLNDKVRKEGFVMYGCPTSPIMTTNYVTKRGETNCCNGDVVDGVCTGNDVCTLSPNNSAGLRTCGALAAENAAAASANMCPPGPNGIPNYFASSDGSLRGCSTSIITADGTAPTDLNALQCIIYSSGELNTRKLDSCENYIKNKADAAKAINDLAIANARCSTETSPTGFFIFGSEIGDIKTVQIPVQKILTFSPGTNNESKIYFAKLNDTRIAVVVTDKNTTRIVQTFSMIGTPAELSSITDTTTYFNISGRGENINKIEKKYGLQDTNKTMILQPLS